jgi:flavodoxin
MKSLVVYSSQTGNTLKLAEVVRDTLPSGAAMYSVDEAPDPSEFDLVVLGFWLKAGEPDPKSQPYLERLKGHKNLFLFSTHGASPDSEHSRKAMNHARSLAEGANVTGTFCCYGEVNPKVLEMAGAKPQPPVWLDDAPNAVGHPDSADLENLRSALKAILS